jgi:hypothetical protein
VWVWGRVHARAFEWGAEEGRGVRGREAGGEAAESRHTLNTHAGITPLSVLCFKRVGGGGASAPHDISYR